MPEEANVRSPFNLGSYFQSKEQFFGDSGLFSTTESMHIRHGTIALNFGSLNEAAWHYRQAIQNNPNSFACYLLGSIFYKTGPFKKAIELFQHFYNVAPFNYSEEYHLAFEKICEMRELLRMEKQLR